jgi:hypothetical protein
MKTLADLIKHYQRSVDYWTKEIDEAVGYLCSEDCTKEHADNIKNHMKDWGEKLEIAERTLEELKKAREHESIPKNC